MQRYSQTPPAKTPAFEVERRDKCQADAHTESEGRNAPLPLPLEEAQLDRVGGGYALPKTTW